MQSDWGSLASCRVTIFDDFNAKKEGCEWFVRSDYESESIVFLLLRLARFRPDTEGGAILNTK